MARITLYREAAWRFFRRPAVGIPTGALVVGPLFLWTANVTFAIQIAEWFLVHAIVIGRNPLAPWGLAVIIMLIVIQFGIRPSLKTLERLAELKEREAHERDLIHDLATAVAAQDHENMILCASKELVGIYESMMRCFTVRADNRDQTNRQVEEDFARFTRSFYDAVHRQRSLWQSDQQIVTDQQPFPSLVLLPQDQIFDPNNHTPVLNDTKYAMKRLQSIIDETKARAHELSQITRHCRERIKRHAEQRSARRI